MSQNVTELKLFFGLVNFYNKFIPNFATQCEPFYKLTRNNVEWKWTNQCEAAFNRIKSTLSNASILTNFDPNLSIS